MAENNESGKSEYDDLAREIVRAQMAAQKEQNENKEGAKAGGWNRPFRSWEAIAAFCGVVVVVGTPVLGIRDGVRDVQTALTVLIKTVGEHETRLHAVENKNIELDNLKDTRGKRLADVEDAWKRQQDVNAQTQGQIIELKAGQQAILSAQQAFAATQQDNSRKLDDLLSRKR